jgi:hypothetical protein
MCDIVRPHPPHVYPALLTTPSPNTKNRFESSQGSAYSTISRSS